MLGVLSKEDILNARQQPGIRYSEIQSYNGGDFLSGLKEFGQRVNEFLQKSKLASNLLNLVPVVGPALSKSAANYGYGDGGVALSSAGGKRLSKKQLQRSLMSR
jgi:hypothetical protein